MRGKAAALKAVCAAIGGLPGRKILVHASYRFSGLAGFEFFLTGPVMYGSIPADAREFNAHGMVESVAEAANANGVTVYTMFPRAGPTRRSDPRRRVRLVGSEDQRPGRRRARRLIVQNEAAALETRRAKTGGTFSLGYKEAPRARSPHRVRPRLGVLDRRRGDRRQGGPDAHGDVKTKDRP